MSFGIGVSGYSSDDHRFFVVADNYCCTYL
jgi:hypothetical protein